jgi:2-keto-4-pentenoate hydratase/2-oxohepta-3-ene-1,7-dioic acid hydratase in catechol pathway
MRLLSHLVDDDERLAVAIDDHRAVDVSDLLGGGPWTMARLLDDVPDNLEQLRGAVTRDRPPAARPQATLRPIAPVRPAKIVAVGRNYREHASEESAALPTAPLLFAKFPSAIVGDGAVITWSARMTAQVDYEAELAVVIGRRALAVERALDHVRLAVSTTCRPAISR